MGILIQLDKMQSRITRLGIGDRGIRKMTNAAIARYINPRGGGLAKFLGVGLLRFGGFLVGDILTFLLGGITINFSSLWGFIVQNIGYLWTFDWNKPDEKMWDEVKSEQKAIVGLAGYAVGDALGYTVCGVLPASTIFKFNEPLALHIFETLGETALGDVAANAAVVIQMASQVAAHAALTYAFTNIRNMLRPENDELMDRLAKPGKMSREDIKKALEDREKPWTFAKAFQEKTEKIENKQIKEFVEQGVQGFVQACIQSGYVIAGGIDSWLALQKRANNDILGIEESVELIIGKKNPYYQATHH